MKKKIMILLIIIIILLIIIFLILVIFVLKNKLDKSKKDNIEQDKTNNVITEGGFCLETVYNLGEMSNILYKAVYIENHPNGEYYINNNRGLDPKADYTENKIVLTFFHLLILKAFQ